MDSLSLISTQRITLRKWKNSDREPFAQLNQDPDVMTYLGAPMSREDSDAAIDKQLALMAAGEPAFWAVEENQTRKFIGCIGVKRVTFKAAFTPCYEIGWRLSKSAWGKGFATEGARAALSLAFRDWDMEKIYSFTVHANIRSQSVMEKIGMSRIIDGDFKHPNLPEDHPLSEHVLYSIGREVVAT